MRSVSVFICRLENLGFGRGAAPFYGRRPVRLQSFVSTMSFLEGGHRVSALSPVSEFVFGKERSSPWRRPAG
jgi:hypothetical protein